MTPGMSVQERGIQRIHRHATGSPSGPLDQQRLAVFLCMRYISVEDGGIGERQLNGYFGFMQDNNGLLLSSIFFFETVTSISIGVGGG